MKLTDIKINLFEVGDYVRTGNGVGIVNSIKLGYRDGGLLFYDVIVQFKFGGSNNVNNDELTEDGFCTMLITKEEYDSESF